MAKLRYIGDTSNLVKYINNSATMAELFTWLKEQKGVQLDTETNVVDSIIDRDLKVIQISDLRAEFIYVIQTSSITAEELAFLGQLLCNPNLLLVIQNCDFEYQIFKKYDIILNNIWDTMIAEQCLYTGYDYDMRFFSLKEIVYRRMHKELPKDEREGFGNDIINDEKLMYAAMDVYYMGPIYKQQYKELVDEDLIYLMTGEYNENRARLAFSEMSYHGMYLHQEKWQANIALAEPIVKEAKHGLDTILRAEAMEFCTNLTVNYKHEKVTKQLPAILTEDTNIINWNSSKQKLELLKWVFPDLQKTSVVELRKYLCENDASIPLNVKPTSKQCLLLCNKMDGNKFDILKAAIRGDEEELLAFYAGNFKDKLIELGLWLPSGTVTVNWNSNLAKLAIFQYFDPKIESTDAEVVTDHLLMNDFFVRYKEYNEANTLLTKYGQTFIDKHVHSDGCVRTRFNTILATGRVSSSGPNMQQLPASKLPEDRQNDYRSCFGPKDPTWKVVGSDYNSQELAMITILSKDPVFMDALERGMDIHSCGAEVVYEENDEWIKATSPGCKFYERDENGEFKKKKCTCKGHKRLRQHVKAQNFGLAYGISEFGLAADLKITVEDAKLLIKKYFRSFPGIKRILGGFSAYGQAHGFIRTLAPMRRKRYFPYWQGQNATPDFLLKKIGRASSNTPIQGSAADMVKIAMIRCYDRMIRENTTEFIQLVLQIHDELITFAAPGYEAKAELMLKEEMEEAAAIILNCRLLTADPKTSQFLEK